MTVELTLICEFKLLCDKKWRNLSEITDRSDVRYCGDCQKPVFFCATYAELVEHVANSQCVAIAKENDELLMGRADPIGPVLIVT